MSDYFRALAPAFVQSLLVCLGFSANLAWGDIETSAPAAAPPPFDPHIEIRLANTTQGPLWPPASIVDQNGDFILVGNLVAEVAPGIIFAVPGQAALVSRATVPPLNAQGREDFTNPFGSIYSVVRPLDLRRDSSDLDLVLHANSFGPPAGDFGGGPRIPRIGDSPYNLNSLHVNGTNCPEIFPARSQRLTYLRPRFPLHLVPIPGFQGDDVAYDIDTGDRFTPRLRNGADCPPEACLGEDPIHVRRTKPITLGEWLKADVRLKITLTDFNQQLAAYTGARFEIKARELLPNSIYVAVVSRQSVLEPRPLRKTPDAPVVPNILVTDGKGRGDLSFVAQNPFPDPAGDDAGLRIVGLALGYKSDFAVWGACPLLYGPGIDIHAVVTSFTDNRFDLTPFITKPAPTID